MLNNEWRCSWPHDATGVINLSWLQESWDWITDIGFVKSDIWHKKCNINNRILGDKWCYLNYFCHHFWCYQFWFNDRHWLLACWLGHLVIIGSLGHMSIIWAINLLLSSVDISPSWPLYLGPTYLTNSLWGHGSNLVTMHFTLILFLMIKLGHDFAHAHATCCRGMCKIMTYSHKNNAVLFFFKLFFFFFFF